MKLAVCMLCFSCLMPWLRSQDDYESMRSQMVQNQLAARDIKNRKLLRTMRQIPRHLFVPDAQKPFAYSDTALPIEEGQTISQPYIVAFMTQALQLKETDRVLEIGTGSGYQAAVLSRLVDSVVTVEIVQELGEQARTRLQKLGYTNVRVQVGDGYHGVPESAPFDAILVTAGAESIPEPLIDQLAPGGRLVIPVGPHRGVRELVLLKKRADGSHKTQDLMAVRFVPFTRAKNK